ncbi:hypothetical protein H5410_057280, partial [Solanum commersonii]
EVAKKKGQEAREYTTREHLRIAELIRGCKKGIPLNSGVRNESASRRDFICITMSSTQRSAKIGGV